MGEAFCMGSCTSGLTGAEAMKFMIDARKKKSEEKARVRALEASGGKLPSIGAGRLSPTLSATGR